MQPFADSLGALLYPVPKPRNVRLIDELRIYMNDTETTGDASDIVASDILRRYDVPSPEAIPPLLWPVIETRAFQDGLLSSALTEVITDTLHRRLPGSYAVPAIAPASEFWWALILLFAPAPPTPAPVAQDRPRYCMFWRDRSQPPSAVQPPDQRPMQYEQRVLEIAKQRAFANEMRWAAFWEQWALLFAVRQTRERHIDANIRARIVSLPLAKEILPSGSTAAVAGATVAEEWRNTIPDWFVKYDANWLLLA